MSDAGMGITSALTSVLRGARRVTVLTGSGVSAESGVPTFRDAQTGLWARYEPQELATPEAFERDPRLVWEWYQWRRDLVRQAEPNPGHRALVELERRVPTFSLATQNVDGLHRRAGSENVLELHGNIMRSKCSVEGVEAETRTGDESVPPLCPGCGAFLRPDVVWFGEALPEDVFAAASEAARNCDVFLSVGTSSLVYPAASLPSEAARSGAVLVEVNPDDTPLTPHADYALRGRAGEVLPVLVGVLRTP
ncbi:MAG: NAD-dependent deacylase [Actinomycetota bacterium]|nr:NAD-dependent deacylase [Actinomycetota bacterium]